VPLTAFIGQQLAGIRTFVEDRSTNLLVMRVDPEMERIAVKVVASFEDAPDNSWAFFAESVAFETPEQYFEALAQSVRNDFAAAGEPPQNGGVAVAPPAPMTIDAGPPLPIEVWFAEFIERTARALRPLCDAVVLVLKPEHISHAESWRESVETLASAIADPAVKLIVFDSRETPVLESTDVVYDRASTEALPTSFRDRQALVGAFMASPTWRVMVVPPASTPRAGDVLTLISENRGVTVLPVTVEAVFQPADFYDVAALRIMALLRTLSAAKGDKLRDPDRAFHHRHFAFPLEADFCAFVEALLATAIPPGGRLAIVLAPTAVRLAEDFSASIDRFVYAASHPRIKYVFLEPSAASTSALWPPLRARRCSPVVQDFYTSPADIRAGVAAKLASGSLTRIETMRYTAVLGGFAFGERDYEQAESLQLQWLRQAVEGQSESDRANAHYNLGNTYLAAENWEKAEEHLTCGVEVSLAGKMDVLSGMCLNNLGLALYRQKRYDLALQSFQAARATFHGLRHLPGVTHVMDSMAAVYEEAGQPANATRLRTQALELYDSMTAPELADGRDAARADLLRKLGRSS
jgi:tetratricopeptide (TPR) repeat protein